MNDSTDKNENIKTDAESDTNEVQNLKIDQEILNQEQPKLSTILSAFRSLDKVCYRLGLLNTETSLASGINWNSKDETKDLSVVLKQLDTTRDEIEQQIVKLKKMMTKRCLTILSWEFIVIFILSSSLLIGSYFAGYWVENIFAPPWLNELLSRPILIMVTIFLVLISFIILHYSLRDHIAIKIAKLVSKSNSKFTLAKAFLINSRFLHSIFRPEPVGLGFINRKRLLRAHELFLSSAKD